MRAGAESARVVLDAGRMLEESIAASGVPDAYALESLERIAREQIEEAEASGRQGFESFDSADGEERQSGLVDTLSAAVAQISIGNTLLAAGYAAGEESERADDEALHRALAELSDTTAALESVEARSSELRQGFEPSAESTSEAPGVEDVRSTAERVVDEIARRASQAISEAFQESLKVLPGKVQDAVLKIGEQLKLGEHAGRLARLGLRAVQRGLDLFSRLIGADALVRAREQVGRLYERLAGSEPAEATVGWLVGVEDVRVYLKEGLPPAGGQVDVFRVAVTEIERLGDRFADVGALATGLVRSIVFAGGALVLLQVAVPHLSLVTAAALAMVVAGLLLFAMDYVGDRPALRTVRGVKLVVADAVG